MNLKLPSLTYLLLFLYVALIPIFGAIYNYWMPYEFYHSTNRYEEYMDIDKKIIIQELQDFFKKFLQQAHGKQIIIKDSIYFDINTLHISDFSIDKGDAVFSLYGSFTNKNLGQAMLTCNDFFFGVKFSDASPDTLENGELLISRVFFSKDKSNFPLNASDIFISHEIKIKYGQRLGVWASRDDYKGGMSYIPLSIMNKINAYDSALKGFPSYSSGNFERMLYFSAMIITTVGLGDIVPISTRARIFVTIEAVIGIIIIGVFLDSLAKKIKKN